MAKEYNSSEWGSSEVTNVTITNGTDANGTTKNPSCDLNDYCETMEEYMDRLHDFIYPKPSEWVLIVAYALTFFVGLIGNFLVCFAIWRNKNMRTVTNMFIVNLSVADLAVIILCLPSALLIDVTQTWFLGTTLCKIHLFLQSLGISVSVLTLSSISVERWYAICHPLRFHSTVGRARAIIIIIWTVSILLALPELIFSTVVPLHPATVLVSTCSPSLWNEEDQAIYQVFLMIAMYFIPLCLMGFAYMQIALVLWRGHIPGASTSRSARSRQPMLNNRHHRESTDNEDQMDCRRKAAKMLVAVVVMFGLCFFPIHLFNIFRYTGVLQKIGQSESTIFALIAHWAAFFNSCINPVIYNFMSEKFRKEFKVAVLACVSCGRKMGQWNRNDAYRVTFNSGRTISVRYSNHTHLPMQNCV
ncbi:orexin receptor type 2-like [Mercenaria mercenaria]|uniref:orexin receptor type 2-like n=1 Tax=Mercenaria mercenaria TaxID=6596 RepID=UPI00234E9BFC|nr:orexin receptor type 2-like [Mercenaria mercenaria]XP_053404464.1 orexin receptor type 2-like [Mercenaria mercenaria]